MVALVLLFLDAPVALYPETSPASRSDNRPDRGCSELFNKRDSVGSVCSEGMFNKTADMGRLVAGSSGDERPIPVSPKPGPCGRTGASGGMKIERGPSSPRLGKTAENY